MSQDASRLIYLLEKYIRKESDGQELKELFALIANGRYEDQVLQFMELKQQQEDNNLKGDEVDWEFMYRAIFADKDSETTGRTVRMPVRGKRWLGYAAALVLALGTTLYIFYTNKNQSTSITIPAYTADRGPAVNKASLTLSGGEVLELLTAQNGTLAKQGNTVITKADGVISYTNEPVTQMAPELFNTVVTPRGGQYKLVLQDGTHVWLNSATSLRYPAAFTGTERRVELSGEAYFEVRKNLQMPFTVKVNGTDEITVLGTGFNVNGYKEERSMVATLVDGSIKVKKGTDSVLVQPGKQAVHQADGKLIVLNADTDKETAWKRGFFQFEGADLRTLMNQISRWYDVDIIYQGRPLKRKFTGEIQRDLTLRQVLKNLERDDVSFHLEGSSLTIRQNP